MLTEAQIEDIMTSDFVRLDGAFPRELAETGRDILWREMGLDPDDPATWAHRWPASACSAAALGSRLQIRRSW